MVCFSGMMQLIWRQRIALPRVFSECRLTSALLKTHVNDQGVVEYYFCYSKTQSNLFFRITRLVFSILYLPAQRSCFRIVSVSGVWWEFVQSMVISYRIEGQIDT